MASLNKVLVMGNLTRDPEVRYTPKGTAVCDLGMALNRNYSTDTGEKREEVTFVDVTLWGRQAELAGQYLSKGRSVFIEGRLKLDSWDDKSTGQKRNKLSIVGENMTFVGGQRSESEGGPPRPNRPAARQQTSGDSGPSEEPAFEEEDDIPF